MLSNIDETDIYFGALSLYIDFDQTVKQHPISSLFMFDLTSSPSTGTEKPSNTGLDAVILPGTFSIWKTGIYSCVFRVK